MKKEKKSKREKNYQGFGNFQFANYKLSIWKMENTHQIKN